MSDLVNVWSSGDAFQGELMRGRLETEGIQVLLKGGGESEAYPAGPVYLFVSTEDETKARAIIDAVNSGAFALSDEDVVEGGAGDEAAGADRGTGGDDEA